MICIHSKLKCLSALTRHAGFAVNAALLSRCRVFHLEPLDFAGVRSLLERALGDTRRGVGTLGIQATAEVLDVIAERSGGDARRALSTLELVVEVAKSEGKSTIDVADLTAASDERTLLYDKSGEEHYAVISAFIKSMRGSDPDAAVYWMMRMLDAGDDPLFVMRRMIIFASEDVGNADPNALCVVQAADHAFRRVGMPEGYYPLAHAATYLALAPKSNAVGTAWQRARELIEKNGALPVPKKLRPSSNASGRALGHGADYKYAHDY
ncbi:MAG: replication-associated recombination protein A, partial [Proteobacteria bacterium]